MIDEMAIVYDVRHGKARKPYVCCECGGIIKARERYFHHFGIWSWGPQYFKVCEDCEQLRSDIDDEAQDYDERTAFTELSESVFNSCVQEWINRFMEIKRKRGAAIPHWMLQRENEAA